MKKLLLILMALFLWAGSSWAQINGYVFNSAAGTYTEITGGTVVATATSLSGAGSLDDVIYPLAVGTIPFNFNFNGTNYTSMQISTNGFITFGTTAPGTSLYTPISGTTAYAGCISPIGRDLNALFNVGGYTGEIRYETLNSTPNRIFVIQYKNFRPYSTSGVAPYWRWNFQIRLKETSNVIECVYDFNFSGAPASATTPQVGLRGANNTYPGSINNRLITSGTHTWATSVPGTSNASTCAYSTTLLPASGLTYTFTPPNPCTGTPDPGNTLASANPACSGVNFTLSLQNATPGTGVTYQWQSSLTGGVPWTNLGTAATQVTSQTVATWYQCVVTCTNSGFSGTSIPVQVTMNSPTNCYCIPTTTNGCSSDYISNVTFNGINRTSTCDGTGINYYPTPNPSISQSSGYTLSVTTGGDTEGVRAWIDWNQDGIFDNTTELVLGPSYLGTNPATYSITVNVPGTATLGATRLRVRCSYAAAPLDPCANQSYGEAEDYAVTVIAPPACVAPSGQTVSNKTDIGADLGWSSIDSFFDIFIQSTGLPAPGPATTPTVNNYNSGYSYTWTGGAAGLTYDWYVRTDCAAGGGTGQSVWTGPNTFTTLLCNPIDQCNYTFRMTDSYGDGWNGNTMAVKQGAVTIQTISLAGGTGPVDVLVGLCDGIGFELFWNAGGSFPLEVGVEIINAFGVSLYYKAPGTGAQNTSLYTGTVNCTPPACPAPTGQTASNYTLVGADLGWVSVESFFDIFIDVTGAPAPGAGTTPTVNNHAGNSLTWTGGAASITYDWYVRADCEAGGGTGQSDWTGPNSFTTLCGSLSVPYSQNFDGVTAPAMPGCFTVENVNGDAYKWETNSTYRLSVPNGAYIRYNTSQPMNDWMFLPGLQLTGGKTYEVSFAYAASASFAEKLAIYWGDSPASSAMVNGPIFDQTFTGGYYLGLGSFTPATSGVYYIGFWGHSDADKYWLSVDDILVTEAVANLTWNGSVNNNWHNTGNWNEVMIPASTSNVNIPAGLTNYPTVTSAAACNNISLGSNATNTATLLDNGLLIVFGSASVQRYFTGDPPPSTYDWHLISSPVSGATAAVFTGMYLQSFAEASNSYTEISDPTTVLNPMEGYGLYSTLNINNTVTFSGDLYLGAQTKGFTASNQGWNLVGNPFVSSIDWDAVIIPSGMTSEVHYIDAVSGNDLSYVKLVGGTGSRYIAPMQGFFVKATASGTLSLGNAQRTHLGADNFYKADIHNLLILEATGENYSDQTWIHFNDLAGVEHDGVYDAYKRISTSNPELPQIYSLTPTGSKLSINGMPETLMVPVGFTAAQSAEFTITAIETSEFKNVILEDLLLGVQTDLLKESYTFKYGLGEPENRFIVHFTPLAVGEIAADLINIYSSQKDVYVSVPANTKGDIVVYNLMGQEVARTLITDVLNKITLDKSAYYVVKVMSNESVVTEKVFVK